MAGLETSRDPSAPQPTRESHDSAAPWTRRQRWLLAALIALAVALRLPALAWGFLNDDHGLMLVLEGAVEHPTLRWWSLFDFGDAAQNEYTPWWTPPDWKIRFFRPLASASHALDVALFGRNAVAHHAVQLAWLALLLAMLARLYSLAGLAPRVALAAVAVFAFDDGSLMPTAWIANRNSLLEAVFLCAAAIGALRYARAPSVLGIAWTLACVLLACLCKESGVSAGAIVAWIWWSAARTSPHAPRLRSAAITALVLVACYVAALLAAGFGAHSEFYRTPWGDPLAFARRVGELVVFGALSVLGPFKLDLPFAFPALYFGWLAVALVVGGVAWSWLARVAARGVRPPFFFVVWSAATLVVQGGAFPSDRLLFTPLIGAAPWLACGVLELFDGRRRRARVAGALLALGALVLSPLALVGGAAQFIDLAAKLRAAANSLEVPRDGRACEAFVLQSGSGLSMLAPDPVWSFETGLRSVRIHPLQAGARALRWTRRGEDEHEFTTLDEEFLTHPFEVVFNTAPEVGPLRRTRDGFEVEAFTDERGELRTLVLRLNDREFAARVHWLTWRDGAFRALTPPAVGESLELPRAAPLDPLLP
jgi:hypothetical protein